MKKISLMLSLLAFGALANAGDALTLSVVKAFQKQVAVEAGINAMLDWKVGEQASYNLDAGFIQGTMVMKVREEITEGFWLDQDISVMGQAIKAEILIDKNTGEILQLIVNGQKQEIPKQNVEIVETKEAEITVPKGTFKCIYARIKDLDSGDESELWINPQVVPIMGMIKTIQPSQMGTVTLELTDFVDL